MLALHIAKDFCFVTCLPNTQGSHVKDDLTKFGYKSERQVENK